jgi:hypothetical protein
MDRSSALTAARELEGFRLSPSAPDVRGWMVLSCDGAIAGRVARLFVDIKTRKVRYIEVVLDGTRPRAPWLDRHAVLVPVGIARRLDDTRSVLVDLSAEALGRAPRIPRRAVTRDDENATLEAYGLPVSPGASDWHRFESEHFDDSRLLAPAGPSRPVLVDDADEDHEKREQPDRVVRRLRERQERGGGEARPLNREQREPRRKEQEETVGRAAPEPQKEERRDRVAHRQ